MKSNEEQLTKYIAFLMQETQARNLKWTKTMEFRVPENSFLKAIPNMQAVYTTRINDKKLVLYLQEANTGLLVAKPIYHAILEFIDQDEKTVWKVPHPNSAVENLLEAVKDQEFIPGVDLFKSIFPNLGLK